MQKVIIFDFDGTMADTLKALVGLYNRRAPRFGCRTIDLDDLETLRSHQPRDLMRDYGVAAWKLPFLAALLRRDLKQHLHDVHLHDGIGRVLRSLREQGVEIGILTSNSKQNVENFLRNQSLGDAFSFLVSSYDFFGKDRVLRRIMRERGYQPEQVIYVGDEVRDVEAANRAGVTSVGVTWGFQTRSALERVNPDYLLDHPDELLTIG